MLAAAAMGASILASENPCYPVSRIKRHIDQKLGRTKSDRSVNRLMDGVVIQQHPCGARMVNERSTVERLYRFQPCKTGNYPFGSARESGEEMRFDEPVTMRRSASR